ncbi:hypothetical protein AVEN_85077-1 [Araneus ventricosus]|uniref:Uncharacterized protein n=1 Tax=Araneus ventricosus TaxID=182803 RepID=A0A4Y2U770_ARAVE|nr:hypothetical protein AVEN_85077-1 [Araneus ventricosus]
MVNKCCLSNCRGNCANTSPVLVYRFPRYPHLKQKLISAIQRENFEPTKYSRLSMISQSPPLLIKFRFFLLNGNGINSFGDIDTSRKDGILPLQNRCCHGVLHAANLSPRKKCPSLACFLIPISDSGSNYEPPTFNPRTRVGFLMRDMT